VSLVYVWFALFRLCCRFVSFFLLLLLIFPFYPHSDVLEMILFGALYSLVQGFFGCVLVACNTHMPWNPKQHDFYSLQIHKFSNGLCLRGNRHLCTQRVHDYHLRSFLLHVLYISFMIADYSALYIEFCECIFLLIVYFFDTAAYPTSSSFLDPFV
jgi:hypothetical protein